MAIAIYTDASRDDDIVALGYYIKGDVTIKGNRYMEAHHTSMEAEFFAVIEGLRIALQHTHTSCTIYSDCQPLVRKMTNYEKRDGDWVEYYNSFQRLVGKFDEWSFVYTDRSNNDDAHREARKALKEGRTEN